MHIDRFATRPTTSVTHSRSTPFDSVYALRGSKGAGQPTRPLVTPSNLLQAKSINASFGLINAPHNLKIASPGLLSTPPGSSDMVRGSVCVSFEM